MYLVTHEVKMSYFLYITYKCCESHCKFLRSGIINYNVYSLYSTYSIGIGIVVKKKKIKISRGILHVAL